MMDDHHTLSAARNHLADALKVLLNPEIMTVTDFTSARESAAMAIEQLDVLLRQSHRD